MDLSHIYIYNIYRREMNPPGQSIIDALNTTTLHIYIEEGDESLWSLHMYIYRREMNPPDQLIIDVLNTAILHIYRGGR